MTDNTSKKMPMNFGHVEPTNQTPIPTMYRPYGYCELPCFSTIDFNTYGEHHLRNMLIGLNSDKPEIVATTKRLLDKYLEFRKTKPDHFIAIDSQYIIPTHDEIKEMMKQKIKLPESPSTVIGKFPNGPPS